MLDLGLLLDSDFWRVDSQLCVSLNAFSLTEGAGLHSLDHSFPYPMDALRSNSQGTESSTIVEQRDIIVYDEIIHHILSLLAIFKSTAPVGVDHRGTSAQAVKWTMRERPTDVSRA